MGIGYYQSELRDLRGNALLNAVVAVFNVGTTTPATIFSNAAGTTPMTASPLPAAAGLLLPGKDVAGNIAFFADDSVEYDVRVTDASGVSTFRARLDPAPVAPGTFPEATAENAGIEAGEWSLRFRATDLQGGSVGLKLRRPTSANALTVTWSTGADDASAPPSWETGLDAGTDDLVLAYSPTGAAHEIGDVIRLRKGGHLDLARSAGRPGLGARLRISADNQEPATLTTLVEHALGAGTPGTVLNFATYYDGATLKFSIGRDGSMNATGLSVLGAGVQTNRVIGGNDAANIVQGTGYPLYTGADKGAFVVRAGALADVLNGLAFQLSGGQKWRWTAGIVNEAVAGAALRSDTTNTNVLVFDGGAGAGTMDVRANVAFEGTTLGFYSTAPVAKPTGVAVTAEGIHAALVTLGLIAA